MVLRFPVEYTKFVMYSHNYCKDSPFFFLTTVKIVPLFYLLLLLICSVGFGSRFSSPHLLKRDQGRQSRSGGDALLLARLPAAVLQSVTGLSVLAIGRRTWDFRGGRPAASISIGKAAAFGSVALFTALDGLALVIDFFRRS